MLYAVFSPFRFEGADMDIKKMRRMKIAVSVLSIFLVICILALGAAFYRLQTVNLFSKNIVLSNAAFVGNGDTQQSIAEIPSRPYTEYAENSMSRYFESVYSAMQELNSRQEEMQKGLEQMQTKLVFSVPHLEQGDALPNGCEAVCAATLLQYCGFTVSPEEFVDEYLPCEPVRLRWGCRFGPNPSEAYAGNPRLTRGGFGCNAPVIAEALKSYLPQTYVTMDVTGTSMPELVAAYVSVGIPVAVWVTQDMQPIKKAYQWQSYDKTETFLYPINQHCMVLCGFDAENYYFSDPLSKDAVVQYPRETVESCYRSMGLQAVAVFKAG